MFSVKTLYHICEVCATQKKEEVKYLYSKYEELLKKTGETSYQVSKATGVGQNTLSNWKTGRSQPKVDKLQKIADHFGVPLTYFLEDITSAVQ